MMKAAVRIVMGCFIILLVSSFVFAAPKKKELSMKDIKGTKTVHWYIKVCSSAADKITLQGGKERSNNVMLGEWKQGDGARSYALPDDVQNNKSVYVQVNIAPDKRQTEACVGFDGWAKKAIHMDKGNENHQVSIQDWADDCACQ